MPTTCTTSTRGALQPPAAADADAPRQEQDPSQYDASEEETTTVGSQEEEQVVEIVDETPLHHHYDDADSDYSNIENGSHKHHVPVTEVPSSSDGDNDVRTMAKRATRHIRFWRLIVLATLLVIGAAATCVVWFGLGQLQEQQHLARYRALVDSASDTALKTANRLQYASQTLSSTISYMATTAAAGDESFPFVTLPLFDALAEQARKVGGMVATIYSPLVSDEDRLDWEQYSSNNQQSAWLPQQDGNSYESIFPYIFSFDATVDPPQRTRDDAALQYLPQWQASPMTIDSHHINYNQLNNPFVSQSAVRNALTSRSAVMTEAAKLKELLGGNYVSRGLMPMLSNDVDPEAFYAYLIEPIITQDGSIGGFLQHAVPLELFVTALLPADYSGLHAVVANSKGQSYTYRLDAETAILLGSGDLHDTAFDATAKPIPLVLNTYSIYTVTFYSSQQFSEALQPNHDVQVIATLVTALLFVGLFIGFVAYDSFVSRRNQVVINAAARSNAILSSLFPTNVRARLFHRAQRTERADDDNDDDDNDADDNNKEQSEVTDLQDVSRSSSGLPKWSAGKRGSMLGSVLDMGSKVTNTAISSVMQIPKLSLKTFLFEGLYDMEVEEADDDIGYKGKPIADLFTETTILFADIAGFTAWSSAREPTQVFTLLETVYRAFDEAAKKRKIFKVETIGDCYVAVAGIPEPQLDHVVIVCRFARDCMLRLKNLAKKLEKSLGPDTGELDLRIGIHSGPVTAGVLRGERSRFQLFGDSMNTASRMESTGIKGRIQLSLESAALLSDADKGHWVIPREDKVIAKGKGEMQTYWLTTQREQHANGIECSSDAIPLVPLASRVDSKTASLIDWNTEVLLRLLRSIVARRTALQLIQGDPSSPAHQQGVQNGPVDESEFINPMAFVINEVQEVIRLPTFDYKSIEKQIPPELIVIDKAVVEQLRDYVSRIAHLYRKVHYHSFEHGSHVTMSVTKLLSRIIAPSDGDINENTGTDNSYGITSDPLTQFSVVLSALIHDVDHTGLSNAQLVKEERELALIYKGKSVAEQHSVNIAWNLLMQKEYRQLRSCIYTSETSFRRFRQLVVNTVMATDIVDKDLKDLRNARWAKAFSEDTIDADPLDTINRKATIVIEHLIQASDVAHTMQHWHIYRKWNERFFLENFQAYPTVILLRHGIRGKRHSSTTTLSPWPRNSRIAACLRLPPGADESLRNSRRDAIAEPLPSDSNDYLVDRLEDFLRKAAVLDPAPARRLGNRRHFYTFWLVEEDDRQET